MKKTIAKTLTVGACLLYSLVLVTGCQDRTEPYNEPPTGIQDSQLELESPPPSQSLDPLPPQQSPQQEGTPDY